MTVLNFPSSPSLDQVYATAGRSWKWDGVSWLPAGSGIDWGRIVSTPTSLAGYGITDAQPADADLAAIAALSGTAGLLKKTAANTWELDTAAYLTGITSGQVTTALGYTPVNPTAVGSTIQGYDADLAAIATLAGTSGILRKTAANTWALDTATYLTGINSSQVTTALGFTPYSSTNPSGYITSSSVGAGTLALVINTGGSTNTSIVNITGTGFNANSSTNVSYQFNVGPALVNLPGVMTGAGSGFLRKTAQDTYAIDTSTYLTGITSGQVTTALGFTPYSSSNPSGFITASASITGSAGSVAWTGVTGTPTTLIGYGITDAAAASHTHSYLPLTGGTLTGGVDFSASYNLLNGARFFTGNTGYNYLFTGTNGMVWRNQADTGTVASLSDNGAFNTAGAITQNGNQVLHAGNYSSYAATASHTHNYLPLSGGTVAGLLSVTGAVTLRSGGDNSVTLGGLNDITLGGTGHSGIITVGRSTLSEGIDVGAAAHGAFRTKTINIGTGGLASSTTTISIGSSVSGATSTVAANGAWTFANAIIGSISGNAATATALQVARTINGVSFDGSANITVADGTKLPLSGGTLTGGLTVGGDLVLSANAGGSRVVGFSSGTNSTLVLQAGGISGSGANLELTRDYYAYLDANETRLRSVDGATIFVQSNSTATNVVTGALKQQNNQVLHAGNYTSYSPSLTGSGASGTWGISISGTAALADSGVAAGTYTSATIQVDAKGRVIAASSNAGGAVGTIPVGGGMAISTDLLTSNLYDAADGTKWQYGGVSVPYSATRHDLALLPAGAKSYLSVNAPPVHATSTAYSSNSGDIKHFANSGKTLFMHNSVNYSSNPQTYYSSVCVSSDGGATWNYTLAGPTRLNTFVSNAAGVIVGTRNGTSSIDIVCFSGSSWSTLSTISAQTFNNVFATHFNTGTNKFVLFVQTTSTVAYAATSTDGSAWTLTLLPGSPSYPQILVNGNKYAYVAGGKAYVSSDGVNWVASTTTVTQVSFLKNGTFVGINSATGAVSVSSDGVTWTATVTKPSYQLAGYSNGYDLVTAYYYTGSYPSTLYYTSVSADGVTWKDDPVGRSNSPQGNYYSLAGYFYSSNSTSYFNTALSSILTLSSSVALTGGGVADSNNAFGVAKLGSLYYLSGTGINANQVYASANGGSTLTGGAVLTISGASWVRVFSTGTLLLAYSDTKAYTSSDGVTWTLKKSYATLSSSYSFIKPLVGGYVIVGSTSMITSVDLNTFYEVSVPGLGYPFANTISGSDVVLLGVSGTAQQFMKLSNLAPSGDPAYVQLNLGSNILVRTK